MANLKERQFLPFIYTRIGVAPTILDSAKGKDPCSALLEGCGGKKLNKELDRFIARGRQILLSYFVFRINEIRSSLSPW